MWGVANLGWMYYEVVLDSEPPTTSIVRFLFGLEIVLIATALFLDQEKDSPRIDAESALDFIQIGIVFFFIYVEYYYLPLHRLDSQSAFLREMRIQNVEDVLITVLAGFPALPRGGRGTGGPFLGLPLFPLFPSPCAAAGPYSPRIQPTPNGAPC